MLVAVKVLVSRPRKRTDSVVAVKPLRFTQPAGRLISRGISVSDKIVLRSISAKTTSWTFSRLAGSPATVMVSYSSFQRVLASWEPGDSLNFTDSFRSLKIYTGAVTSTRRSETRILLLMFSTTLPSPSSSSYSNSRCRVPLASCRSSVMRADSTTPTSSSFPLRVRTDGSATSRSSI